MNVKRTWRKRLLLTLLFAFGSVWFWFAVSPANWSLSDDQRAARAEAELKVEQEFEYLALIMTRRKNSCRKIAIAPESPRSQFEKSDPRAVFAGGYV